MKKKSAIVIFNKNYHSKNNNWWRQFDTIIATSKFEATAQKHGLVFKNIDELVEPGSIYEASAFAEELSRLKFTDGSRIAKSFTYKGYELWWIYYNRLFLYFGLPYTKYKKLLGYLESFQSVHFYQPPYRSLFYCYLQAYGCKFSEIAEPGLKIPFRFSFGVLLQIIITLISLPILILGKRRLVVFIGDKFDESQDYDFRVKFIYQELRGRNIPFVEFVRSLESWKTVLRHALTRMRPVIYSEAVGAIGRIFSIVTGGRRRAKQEFGLRIFAPGIDPEKRFKLLIATQHLFGIYGDVLSIRIMRWILRVIGVKAAFITAANERNFHTVLGCKLNNIPTVGIMHGAASKYYVAYDFMRGFDGEKMLSVDKYGLWSEWWREYYLKNSNAYRPEQLFVSGPMRPLERKNTSYAIPRRLQKKEGPIKILFVPGELSEPEEIIPYLLFLMEARDISVFLTFRPYRDGFEKWLKRNNSQIIEKIGKEKILRGSIYTAISKCDVVVGSYSTAVLEALLQLKPLTFFKTNKWEDYFKLNSFGFPYNFFAESPLELINCIKQNIDIPEEILKELQKKFFGDPYKNGSKWVVDQLNNELLKERIKG